MAAAKPEWARRFYGMEVTTEIAKSIAEGLTDRETDELVDAHLGRNHGYFGAIDKTLAGFVVLDDTDDNYTLFDLRDGGQVWWQDHETRDVALRDPKASPQGTRVVSTPALCERYQWLVWLLAIPLERHGTAIQTLDVSGSPRRGSPPAWEGGVLDELVRNGIGRVRHAWPRREALAEAFAAELALLRGDPHLAIYWLLHTTVVADHVRREQVVDAIGEPTTELVRAFVARLGALPLAGDLPIVPGFRARRALAQTYGETELLPEEVPRACLIALELAPATSSLVHGLQITSGLERGQLTEDEVVAVLARIPERTAGTELVRALLAKRGGATASAHADELARQVPEAIASGEPWWFALEALWQTHELAYAGPALVAATRALITRDRFHRRALQMAMRSAQIAGEDEAAIDRIDAELDLADQVLGPFQKLVEHPREWDATVVTVTGAAAEALAWRVLQRVAINKPSPELAAWAAQQLVGSPPGAALIGAAFVAMDAATQSGVVGAVARVISHTAPPSGGAASPGEAELAIGPDHPLVAILLACIDGPEPAAGDIGAQFVIKRAKDAALVALAPWFETPALFERLIALVERPASGSVVDLVWAKLFNPFEKASYVVPRLAATQAIRAARAMIATALRHPSIRARNAAGHQLYRFSHPGAEAFLIAALAEYGAAFAAVTGPGGAELDHGKTEHDQLEDVVANLYAAVRGLGTPAARDALVERIFDERRAFWRLGNALGEVWSPELHAHVLARLAERKDARAAGVYAYALHDFVKQGAPLVELVRVVHDWDAEGETARGFLHYALVVGIEAALAARDYDLVRLAHEHAARITEPALEPDAHARRRTWTSPLSSKPVKDALAAALSGEAAAERAALQAAAAKARAARKPTTQIKDAALGQLANAQVASRLLHDRTTGEVWFRDTERGVHYFDGYAVVTAPFSMRAVGFEGAAAELAGATAIAERAVWWDRTGDNFRDAVRIGRHILIAWGLNNGSFERYLLGFGDDARAAAAFAQLRANPVPGFAEAEAYYLPGKGAVVRTYLVRNDGGEPQRHVISVVDNLLEGVGELDSEAAAIAEHVKRELAWLTTGGVMTCLEWTDARRRRTDRTVREWIAARTRNDGRTATWHVEALDEVARYLADHRVQAPLETELAAPATPADVAAFAAARTHPVPTALDTLWRTIGGASWKLGERGLRLLTPLEVLARRPRARAAAEALLAKLPPAGVAEVAPIVRSLDVLVERLDGKPATFVADLSRDDGRVFVHAVEHVNDLWWEKSLAWMLATGLLGDLEDAIATAAPSVERLKYGQTSAPTTKPKAKPPKQAKPSKQAKPAPKKPATKAKAKAKPKRAKLTPKNAKSKPKTKRR